MSNRLAQFFSRIFGGAPSAKSSETWIASTVTAGEASRGRYSQAPGAVFTGRATQYVLICAMYVARLCASQRLRLYAPARMGGGKLLNARTARGRKRLDYLKRRTNGPGLKAAEYGEYAGDIREIDDHPVLDLLRKPNPWQTGTEFCELSHTYLNLAGNAYLNTWFDDSVPEMYHLGPQYVTILHREDNPVAGYFYARDRADPATFAPEDVIHLKFAASPLSPWYGVGPLQAVLLEADLAAAATQAEVYRWLQGGRPDFVVKVDAATASNKEQRDQIKAEIKRETQGVKKSGRFLIMGNSEIVPLGFRPKDMEYVAGLNRSDELIWNAFGVPQSELKMNDANYASASTGNVQFLSRTIAPQCCRYAEYMTELLLPKFDVQPGEMWFAYDEIVPEDELKEAEMDRQDVTAGIITLDEARANRGLEAYPNGVGALPRVNGTSLERLDAPPVPSSPPQFNVNQPPEDQTVAKAIVGLLADRLEVKADHRLPGESTADCVSRKIPILHREHPDWSDDQCAAAAYSMCGGKCVTGEATNGTSLEHRGDGGVGDGGGGIPPIAKGLTFYGLHAKDAVITEAPPGTMGNLDSFAARLDRWYRDAIAQTVAKKPIGGVTTIPGHELQTIIDEELRSLFQFSAIAAASEVGKEWKDVPPSAALEFLGTYKVRLADSITDDLAQSLNAAIRGGLEAGDSYDQIARRITEQTGEIAGYRAERIARTETANALTEGRIFAWDDLGVPRKQWGLSGNPCEVCQAIAATYVGPIPMTQAFFKVGDTIPGTAYTVEWRDINGPPSHPNCSCFLIPVQ